VLAFSDIIDFLLRLLTDEAARAEFDQDPEGTLGRAGLDGVTAQDIRDARLQLADSGATRHDGSSARSDGDDPVREIHHTTAHYTADHETHHADAADHGSTFLTIDDRDTLFFQSISDDDLTVTDNSVAISDSFNEDSSVRNLTAIQANGSFNSDDDVTVTADDSFNSDNDLTAVQDNDVTLNVPAEPEGLDDAPPPEPEPHALPEPEPVVDDAPEDDAPEDDGADDGAGDSDALAG
jgi:hypothetical protein